MTSEDFIYRRALNAKNQDLKEKNFLLYGHNRNLIVDLLRKRKVLHFRDYFERNSKSIKKTWDGVKSLIRISKLSVCVTPSTVTSNGCSSSRPNDIATAFNEYFSSAAKSLDNNIKAAKHDYNYYLKSNFSHSMYIADTTATEISKIIDNLLMSKASGPNSIPTAIHS